MSVLALIPARSGSKGIPWKNKRRLGDISLTGLAVQCAHAAGLHAVLTTDDREHANTLLSFGRISVIDRPTDLAQDDTPMLAVVQHALEQIPGPPEQIIALLQPTQPFRTPEHIRRAIALLQERPNAGDSVVSVVELPRTHHPALQCAIDQDGAVWPWAFPDWRKRPACRQDVRATFKPDGTIYAFWRRTVIEQGSLFGRSVRPLILDPSETCELDTEADWQAVQARWQARHGATA